MMQNNDGRPQPNTSSSSRIAGNSPSQVHARIVSLQMQPVFAPASPSRTTHNNTI